MNAFNDFTEEQQKERRDELEDFDDDDETINRFKKAKNNIPHLIAVLGEMALIIDKDGTAYCGLQTLLKKGLDGLSFR